MSETGFQALKRESSKVKKETSKRLKNFQAKLKKKHPGD